MLKKGDKVLVLDEDQQGVVQKVETGRITIETPEGFLLFYQEKELLKVDNLEQKIIEKASTKGSIIASQEQKVGPVKRSFVKEKRSKNKDFIMEVDLHIEKLTKNYARMEKYDMLTLQLDTARGQLEWAIANRIPRIVFIHGVGEGVLKTELEYLFSRYPEVVAEDANYQKYGLGATQIYIKQNVR